MTTTSIYSAQTDPMARQAVHSRELRTLDAWRGAAALWVLMVHACLPTISSVMPGLRHNPVYAISLLGGLGVQMFFVISGFCIANAACSSIQRPWGYRRFIWGRVWRIYPPYLAACAMTIALSLIARWAVAHHVVRESSIACLDVFHRPVAFYFATVTLTQVPLRQPMIDIVFWSLCYEVAFYGIVLIVMAGAGRPQRLIQSLHCITIISLVGLSMTPQRIPFPFDLWPQFGFGVLVFDLVVNTCQRRQLCWAAAIVGMGMIYASCRNLGGDEYHPGSRLQIITCIGFAATLTILSPFDESIRSLLPVTMLSTVGLFSYSVYLTHPLVCGVVLQIGKRIPFTERGFIIVFAAEIVTSLAGAAVFFFLAERPFIRRRRKHSRTELEGFKFSQRWLCVSKVDPPVCL